MAPRFLFRHDQVDSRLLARLDRGIDLVERSADTGRLAADERLDLLREIILGDDVHVQPLVLEDAVLVGVDGPDVASPGDDESLPRASLDGLQVRLDDFRERLRGQGLDLRDRDTG